MGVTGSSGSATIKGLSLTVKNLTLPVVNITSPGANASVSGSSLSFVASSSANADCWIEVRNFDRAGWCSDYNTTASDDIDQNCNVTTYEYNGSISYDAYVSKNYLSSYDGSNYTWFSGSTGMITGARDHSYTFDISLWQPQHYSLRAYCNDEDYNYFSDIVTVNVTG